AATETAAAAPSPTKTANGCPSGEVPLDGGSASATGCTPARGPGPTTADAAGPPSATTTQAGAIHTPSQAPTGHGCPNGTICIGTCSAPASRESASGVSCSTVAALLRSAWIWRWGELMWGGTPGVTPGGNPPGWSCEETYE